MTVRVLISRRAALTKARALESEEAAGAPAEPCARKRVKCRNDGPQCMCAAAAAARYVGAKKGRLAMHLVKAIACSITERRMMPPGISRSTYAAAAAAAAVSLSSVHACVCLYTGLCVCDKSDEPRGQSVFGTAIVAAGIERKESFRDRRRFM